ncbi:MAG: J domain-containing protein [Chloroflexi bacterium]|nr:J domain-containing protein [Chloroflexota bacterium]
MDYKDYYSILGVPKGAAQKEIQSAYRKLARKYHPDVNKGDKASEAKFKEINEAYQVLGDPEQRKKYDALGANWRQYEQWQRAAGANEQPFDWAQFGFRPAGQRGGSRGYSATSQAEVEDLFENSGLFSDFFNTFFSGTQDRTSGRERVARRRGGDVDQPVDVTLEEAAAGTTRTLQLTDASGRTRRIEVKVPPGVREASRVRVAGQGGPGLGGPAGDLYLVVHLLPHPTFERRGDDLVTKVPVPLTAAVLGGEVEVPTLRGKVALKIPAETQNGRVFRLRGLGMPRLEDPEARGDLLAEMRVVLPEGLSPREREIFEELARLRTP